MPGVWSSSATVALGAVFRMVTGDDVSGVDESDASDTVTRTRIRSPRSPFPAVARLRVGFVAPGMSVPFLVHWYWVVNGSPSASCDVTAADRVSFVWARPG